LVLHQGLVARGKTPASGNAPQTRQNALQGDKKKKAGKDTGQGENVLKRLFQKDSKTKRKAQKRKAQTAAASISRIVGFIA
jgi:hypothetical protein